jgi:hypothetical protein
MDEGPTVAGTGIFSADFPYRLEVITVVQYGFRHSNGKDRIVREATLRMEEGKILGFDGMVFVNRSDDVASDGTYHKI